MHRDGNDLLLEVRVQPRASRSGFAGVTGGRLRVRLAAPPVDGRANAALLGFVADACGLTRARVTLERGLASRDKRLRLHGLAQIPPALQTALEG